MTLGRVIQIGFCVFSVVLLLGLSIWQFQRMFEKQALLSAAQSYTPEATETVLALQEKPPELLNFHPAIVEGSALEHESFRLLHSDKRFGVGFRYVHGYRQADGSVMLVDLGYIPDPTQGNVNDAPTAILPPEAPLQGILRQFKDRGWLTPPNNLEENFWFSADLAQIATALNAKLTLPAVLVVTDPVTKSYPIRSNPYADLPNNHLNYAITWLGMAIAWVVLSGFWLRKTKPKRRI